MTGEYLVLHMMGKQPHANTAMSGSHWEEVQRFFDKTEAHEHAKVCASVSNEPLYKWIVLQTKAEHDWWKQYKAWFDDSVHANFGRDKNT